MTEHFRDEKERYISGKYSGNTQLKKGKPGKRKPRQILLLVEILALILAGYFFGVWDKLSDRIDTQECVEFSSDSPSQSIVDAAPGLIPEYEGIDRVVLNENMPNFTAYDLSHIKEEDYTDLDFLGRCGTATAMIDHSMMPTEKRGSIREVKPSGWNQEKYPGIIDSQPPYLYNRCHLIAYALTGQNANEKNLITGTRYLNVELMLPYEIQVAEFLDTSDYHVLYRVSPYFKGIEMLSRGVEMEAYSVEDKGEGVCFHVFLYNVQPGVEINYRTGRSTRKKEENG